MENTGTRIIRGLGDAEQKSQQRHVLQCTYRDTCAEVAKIRIRRRLSPELKPPSRVVQAVVVTNDGIIGFVLESNPIKG